MLIIAIVVVRALALYRFPKKCFLVLWGVVVLRLLVPVSIPLQLPEDEPPAAMPVSPVVEFYEPAAGPLPNTPAVEAPPPAPEPFTFPYEAVWLMGVCAAASFFLYSYARCRREFQPSVPCENDAVTEIMAGLPLRRRVQVRQSEQITAPLTYGVFRPVILVPANMDMEDRDRLRFILTHEYVHIRRFDALTKLLLTTAVCAHWFNLLVWVMYELANRDIELSCDEEVLRRLGATRKKQYAMTLLHLEETRSRTAAPLTSYFGKHATKERITAMANMKKYTRPMLILAAVIALTICVSAAFTVSSDDGAEQPNDSGRRTPNEEVANGTGSAKPDAGAVGEGSSAAMGIIGSKVYDYSVVRPDDDAVAGWVGTESNSDISEYTEDPAPVQNGEVVSESGNEVPYENAVRGDTALILARGGTLLPDDDPKSYTRIDDHYYKCYVAPDGSWRTEYKVGNEDILHDVEKSLLSSLKDGDYPVNSNGETYGPINLSFYVGYTPDLYEAMGTNGEVGYVRTSEVEGIQRLPEGKCSHEYPVNLYDAEGKEILGEFPISCGGHFGEMAGLTVEEAKNIIAEGSADTEIEAIKASLEATPEEESSTNVTTSADVVTSRIAEKHLVNGKYPTTADGKTYGPIGLIPDEEPDLVSVIATNGKSGYAKFEEFDPYAALLSNPNTTPEELAYAKAHLDDYADILIPVYDLNGNVIGQFVSGSTQSNIE